MIRLRSARTRAPQQQEQARKAPEHGEINQRAEVRLADECAAQPVHAIRQRVEMGQQRQRRRQVGQRVEGARQKEDRHHQEVHGELEPLHILQAGPDHRPQRGEDDRNQRHEQKPEQHPANPIRTEPGDQADDQDERALHQSVRGPAEGAAGHYPESRYGRYERLFQEPELPVP